MLIDSFAKLNSTSRNAISAAFVILVAIAMYDWIVAPHVAHLHAVQQYESVVAGLAKKNKILSSAVRIKKKNLEQLHEKFAQVQSTLFMANQAKEFFSDLQAISAQAGCTVHSLNLVTAGESSEGEPSNGACGIVTKSALLSVIGGYGNIVRLVEMLKAREQKVWMDSIRMANLDSFGSAQDRDGSGRLKCDMTITICTIQDKEAMPHEN